MLNKLSAINLIGVILIVGIALSAPWGGYTFLFEPLVGIDNLTYKQYSILFMLVVLMPLTSNFFIAKNRVLSFTKSQSILLFLFLLFVISFFWAKQYLYYFDKIVIYIIATAIIGYVSAIEINRFNLEKISFFLVLTGLLIAVIGISQHFFPEILTANVLPYYTQPGPSTFGNKNMASQIAVLTYPIAVFLWLKSKNKIFSFVAGLSSVIIFAYIYLAISKASYIALFIENIVLLGYFFFSKNKTIQFNFKKLFPIFTAFLLLLLVIILSENINFEKMVIYTDINRLVDETSGASQNSRFGIWSRGAQYFLNSPIYGYGAGGFNSEVVNDGVQHVLRKAHNDFLETSVELGLFGLLLLSLFIFYLIKDLVRVNKNSDYADFFNIFFVSIIGISVSIMVSFPLQLVGPVTIISLLSSLIMFEAKKFQTPIINITIPNKKFLDKILILFFYFLIILSFLFVHRSVIGMSNLYANSGVNYTKFNPEKLKNNAVFTPGFESVLFKFSDEFYEAGYKKRSAEILSISTDLNKRDTFASRRQFKYAISEKDLNKAEEIANVMKEFNTYHPVTMLTLLDLHRAKSDIKSAKKTYKFYKDYYFNTSKYYDLRAYYYLLEWSVILQEYDDTEVIYAIIKEKYVSTPDIENIIAKYYLYTSNIDKAKDKVVELLDKGRKDVIDQVLIDFMEDNNLVVFDK